MDTITKTIPYIAFAKPDMSTKEVNRIKKVIESGWLTTGPVVREFEARVAGMSNCKRCVAFDSCTGAMEMTLRLLNIGPGDEVITTPYTYSATAEVIRNVGAKIVFVDIDEKSFEMDYDKVASAITEKTKAVMPVDIGGKICDYQSLYDAIETKSELFRPSCEIQEAIGRVAVIADAAHSFAAEMDGKMCGEFADFTCFSFHVLKGITTGGEGGAVVWNDIEGINGDDIENRLRLLGDHGQTSRNKEKGWEYDIALFGYNSIMTDIDAAMGMAQLDRFNEILLKRERITKKYDLLFRNVEHAHPLIKHIGEHYMTAMHLYPIELDVKDGAQRDEVYRILKNMGVPCNVHYKPLPMMTAYKNEGYDIADYPNAFNRFSTLLTIPYHTSLTDEELQWIVEDIERAVESVI